MTVRERPDSLTLQLSASGQPATASPSERVIEGLCAPYGPVGNSSLGAITFAQGSLSFAEVGRVKLLLQHNPDVSLGYALALEDRPDGLWGRFAVAEGPEGDRALQEAADGRRDGLSVGVRLSEDIAAQVMEKLWDGDTSPTAAAGQLLEVSQVSIPAFDDARIPASAAVASAALSGHVTLSVAFTTPRNPAAPAAATPKENPMPETTVSAAAPAPAEVQASAPAPAPNPAASPSTAVASEAPVYTFDGRGPSFVRDVFHARMSGDLAAMGRLNRFNEMMRSDAGQVGLVTAAVETRTTAPNYTNNGYRPDMLVAAIDKGRPLVSRIGTITLTDATPFRLPTEGDFTSVGDHTEGQNHATEGDLTMGEVTVSPGAISGAYRLTRELIDASNPAIDQIALRAMARDYRRASEAKVVAALLAADGTPTINIDKVLELRQELNTFYDVADEPASFVATSTSYYNTLLGDVDSAGRPHLASVNPQNAVGVASPGWTGAHIDGVELVKSSGIAVNDAFIVNAADVLIGESALQTFRFDEVEGPGIVKLALWAYFVAKVTRSTSVQQITSAAS